MKDYTITQDILYTNFIRSKPNLSEASIIQYKTVLNKFCKAVNQPLSEIIKNCKEQQEKVLEKTTSKTIDDDGNTVIEKSIIKFDINNPESYINIYLNTHLNYCINKKNSTTTLNHDMALLSTFLKYYNVQLPKMEKYHRNESEWNILTKEDFNFIINDSTIAHASLIHHLIKSGMRITDALKLTIGDFMKATSEYHNYIDVNEFIDNAPQDMIATYDFYPDKTKKFKIRCITFTDPETNNLILQNLRRIKNETLPKLNQKLGTDLQLSKHDALFASKKQQYKGHLSQHSVSDIFYKKNAKLREHHIQLIDEKINKGELSPEDRQKAIEEIPKFHAHGCRKFFISTINKNCGNLRVCTLMEGHKSPVYTDSSYVKFDVQDVKEAYMAAIPDLSLENTETKVYTSEVRREMENRIRELEQEVQVKDDKVELLFKEFAELKKNITWEDVKKEY